MILMIIDYLESNPAPRLQDKAAHQAHVCRKFWTLAFYDASRYAKYGFTLITYCKKSALFHVACPTWHREKCRLLISPSGWEIMQVINVFF